MKNALQEQLLKAGLATEDQLRKKKPPRKQRPKTKNKPRNPAHKPKPKSNPGAKVASPDNDLRAAYEARAKQEKAEAEQKKKLAAQRKANRVKIHKLLAANKLNAEDAEHSYQFIVGDNIKRIYVTAEQQQQLKEGKLAITFLGGKRCLISIEIAAQISELDPEKIIIVNDKNTTDDIDNEYADYQVPDDLTW